MSITSILGSLVPEYPDEMEREKVMFADRYDSFGGFLFLPVFFRLPEQLDLTSVPRVGAQEGPMGRRLHDS